MEGVVLAFSVLLRIEPTARINENAMKRDGRKMGGCERKK